MSPFHFNFDDFEDLGVQLEITESAQMAVESLDELAGILEQHSELEAAAEVRRCIREVRATVGRACDRLIA